MFRYVDGIDKYIDERRMEVIRKNNNRIINIRTLLPTFGKSELVKLLTSKYLEVVEKCSIEIYEKPDSTISLISNLRFLFETCITTRLLTSEENFKYKVRYSIYKHQLDKANSHIKYSKLDFDLISTVSSKEKELHEKLDKSNSEKIFAEVDQLYDELGEEISILLDQAEFNGADYHKEVVNRYIDSQIERKNKISKEWEEKKKLLLADSEACALFDFRNQISKVESELKDTRSWKQKAKDVGLSELYEFIYDYTSALMHSTSYAVLTPKQLDISEITMILSLATRLNCDILRKLKSFSGVPNMKVLHVDG